MFKYLMGHWSGREQHKADSTPTGANVAQNVRPESGEGFQALVMSMGKKNDSKMYLGKSTYFFKAT